MVHPARGENMLLLLQHSPKSELVVADVDFQAVVQRSGIDPRQLPRVQAFSLSDDTPLPIQFVPELTFDPGTAILPAAPRGTLIMKLPPATGEAIRLVFDGPIDQSPAFRLGSLR